MKQKSMNEKHRQHNTIHNRHPLICCFWLWWKVIKELSGWMFNSES